MEVNYCERDGWIYAIKVQNYIKIGWSQYPKPRLESARSMSPFPVEIVGVKRGTIRQEWKTHKELSGSSIRGEWFLINADVERFLDTLEPFSGSDRFLHTPIDRARMAVGGSILLGQRINHPNPDEILAWKRVPEKYVVQIEIVTGVPRHDLRPDIYPAPPVSVSRGNPH